jgi:sugar phosphate isomerase/epimerase
VFTGYTTDSDSYNADWSKCVTAIRECAAVTAEHGLILGLQNHHDVGVSSDSFLEFLNDVDHPNCRAMFDPWSPALHGDDLYACAKTMAPYMVQTTLADYVRLKRFAYVPGLINYRELDAMVRAVPLGDGFVDLEAFFTGLKEGGFDGYVAYEMCSPLRGGGAIANLDASAAKSLEAIRRLITR